QHLTIALSGARPEVVGELRRQDEWAQRLYSQDRYAPRPSGGTSSDGAESLAGAGRPDSSFKAAHIDRLAGQVGNAPQRRMITDLPLIDDADWVGRQLGCAVDGPWLFVSNRFQVVAYHVDQHRAVWQSPAPAGQMQFAQKSTFTATRPLVDTECLYIRLFYSPAGTLGCIDRLNGQFRWTYTPVADGEIVSDPFWLGEGLSVLQLARTEQQESVLRLITLDPRTGFVWAERDLLRLRERWWLRRYAEVTQTASGVVAALGGVVVYLDDTGRIQWVRRQLLLPAKEAPGWVRQHFQPPWLDSGRLFVFQPGVPVLECLQAETGKLLWSRPISGVERLLGTAGTYLVLQTRRSLVALDKRTGETIWSHEADGIVMAATLHGPDQARFLQRREEGGKRTGPLQLVTVTLDGKESHVNAALDDWQGGDPRAGPLVPVGSRLWTFWAASADDPTRDVAELRPVASGGMP
ncbi:MAG: PQQ-binding-like beta-propeller repeat protein, partial [Pirellulaceae bacterium]